MAYNYNDTPKRNPWDKLSATWKGRRYTITGKQYATIQDAYNNMLRATSEGEAGSHSMLKQAFCDAGITGLVIAEYKQLFGRFE